MTYSGKGNVLKSGNPEIRDLRFAILIIYLKECKTMADVEECNRV